MTKLKIVQILKKFNFIFKLRSWNKKQIFLQYKLFKSTKFVATQPRIALMTFFLLSTWVSSVGRIKLFLSSILIDWLYSVLRQYRQYFGHITVIICEILKFPWRPSRAYSSSKSSETVFCVPRGLFSLTWGTI